MIGLRRLISGFLFVLSLITLVGMLFMLNDLLLSVFPSVNFTQFISVIETGNFKDILYKFTMLMYGIFTIAGVPLIVFILSMIGLSLKDD